MKRILFLLTLSFAVVCASDVTQIKQNLLEALAAENLKTVEVNARYAEEGIVVADELLALLGQLKDGKPKQPVSELMTVEQANTFGELSQKNKYFLVSRTIVSRRERDLRVIEDLIILAANEFEWNKQVEESTNGKNIYEIFAMIDSVFSDNIEKLDTFPFVNDRVDGELLAFIKILSENFTSKFNILGEQFKDSFRKRTGLNEIKNELLTLEEKRLQNTLKTEMNRYLKYMTRLGAFRCLYSAMTIDNKWRMEDVVTTNGNMDKVGLRLGTEVNTTWTPTAKLFMGLSWHIAEKFPSPMMAEFEKASKVIEK